MSIEATSPPVVHRAGRFVKIATCHLTRLPDAFLKIAHDPWALSVLSSEVDASLLRILPRPAIAEAPLAPAS